MSTVLVGYGSIEGQTRKISRRVAQKVEAMGHEAVLYDLAEKHDDSEWPNPDAVIIGAPIHEHHFPAAVKRYLKSHSDRLKGLPGMFLSVSLAAMSDEEGDKADLRKLCEDFAKSVHWAPVEVHQIAGALRYTEYNFFKRFILRQIMRAAGGPTDTAQDFEFTDWDKLDEIVEGFVKREFDEKAVA